MANEEQLNILKQGVETWNAWREAHRGKPIDLRDANLSFANLSIANLSFANLSFANLSNTDLSNTNLSRADLSFANLTSANLKDTIFEQATVRYTTFANVDLSVALDLTTLQQPGPSTVGIDTLYKSQGRIPPEFLRGCGVPDSFITYIDSLIEAQHGIPFHSCFISYSHHDEAFARRLYDRLRQEHVRVWYAPEDMAGGKKTHEQIDEAIRTFNKLLIVLSPHSIQSPWVERELRKARKEERATGQRKLFPIRLTDITTLEDWQCQDSLSRQDLAEEVRQYHIPDFSHWSNDRAFETAFARLLKDLHATTPAAKQTHQPPP